MNANRVAELNSDGARLRSWDVDLNPFKPRVGEVLIGAQLIDRRIGDETVSDIALRSQDDARLPYWVIDKVRLGTQELAAPTPELSARRLRRGAGTVRHPDRDAGRGRPTA